jgi:hypothetical protein
VPRLRGTPAFGEIKKHNVNGIRAGLRDLHQAADRHPGEPAYLVTYRYTGRGSVSAYLLRPNSRALSGPVPTLTPGRERNWLADLGDWWEVLASGRGPRYTLPQWWRLAGPTVFGSLLEPYIRQAFLDWSNTVTRNRSHVPTTPGIDLLWTEVAEFLQELSNELVAWPSPERR